MSEYDPVFGGRDPVDPDELDHVRERFLRASRPFLSVPWTWACWAVLLPTAAAINRSFQTRWQPLDILLLWSVTILVGGIAEAWFALRNGWKTNASPLAGWVFGIQGNLSLIAVVLSGLAAWYGFTAWLPGIWLLLLGHSFFVVGGLSYLPMRTTGVIFQLAGAAALIPQTDSLLFLGLGTGLGTAWMAFGIWRDRRAARREPGY